MIPVRLVIQGIYSYQNRQVINFEQLTESGLFGIFGPVGSGKSAILEAISFALYGETERLHNRDNRYYNMMNLRSREMVIEFVFRMGGPDSGEYMFTARARRNSNHFDKVTQVSRAGYCKLNGEWKPLEDQSAERIIGLSYDNFKRTVIIPQGQFQDFLQMGDKERTVMLREIFHLDKFELYDRVTRLESDNERELHVLRERMISLNHSDPKIIDEHEQKLRHLVKEHQEIARIIQEKEQQIKKMEHLQRLYLKLTTLSQELAGLEEQKSAFMERRERLRVYEDCRNNFGDIFGQKASIIARIAEIRKTIAGQGEKLKGIKHQLEDAENERKKLADVYSERERLRTEAEDCKKLITERHISGEMRARRERIHAAETAVSDGQRSFLEIQHKISQVREGIREKRNLVPNAGELTSIVAWFETMKNLREGQKSILDLLTIVTGEIDALHCEKDRVLCNEFFVFQLPGLRLKESPEGIVEQLKEQKQQVIVQLKDITEQLEAAAAQSVVSALAAQLREGNPCPLCGSVSHPNLASASAIEQEKKHCQNERSRLETLLEHIEKNKREIELIAVRLKEKEKVLADCRKREKEIEKKISDHQKKYVWNTYADKDEDVPRKELEKLSLVQGELEKLEIILEQLERESTEKKTIAEQQQQELDKLRNELSVKEEIRKSILASLMIINNEENSDLDVPMLEERHASLIQHYEQIEVQYKVAEEKVHALTRQVLQCSTMIAAEENHASAEDAALRSVSSIIEKRLAERSYSSASAVEKILGQQLHVEQERAWIERFEKNLNDIQTQLHHTQEELGGQRYSDEEHVLMRRELDELGAHHENLIREESKTKSEIGTLRAHYAQRVECEKLLSRLQTRADTISELKKIFKASGFVSYVSSKFLRNLCNTANDRFFKLTRQSLKLELDESNSFQVRDYLNGGTLRSVKTLSGGQLFQASLCLALALADNVNQVSRAGQSFFFLDEGFGSQDKESLQVIFNTLKSLRKEKKIVGIISHVEELQQEIDVYLAVHRDEENGSGVTCSWKSR